MMYYITHNAPCMISCFILVKKFLKLTMVYCLINTGSFSGLTGLTSLNLARNRIKTISPGCFSTLTSLAYLDLSDNRLTRVNPQDLLPLSPATQIRLDGNPWDCSCGVEDFVIFLRGSVF